MPPRVSRSYAAPHSRRYSTVGGPHRIGGTGGPFSARREVPFQSAANKLNRDSVAAWPIMRIGLLRSACGQLLSAIGSRVGRSTATVHGRVRQHVELVRSDSVYASVAASVLSEALEVDWRMGRREMKVEGAKGNCLKEDAR